MARAYLQIAGADGGDDGEARTPVEAPDSLQSRAMVQLLDLIGEGQIGGLVGGAQSVFFDDTPLQNADGTMNFAGISWDARSGTQDQSAIEGFSQIETPFNIGVQVKYGVPYPVAVTNPNADRVRVTVSLPALMSQNMSNGDINGTSVKYKFAISKDGGPFLDVEAARIWSEGGTWSQPSASVFVATPVAGAYNVAATVSIAIDGVMVIDVAYRRGGVDHAMKTIKLDRQTLSVAGLEGMSIEMVQGHFEEYVESPSDCEALVFTVVSSIGTPTVNPIIGVPVWGEVVDPTLIGGVIKSHVGTAECTITGKTRSRYQRDHLLTLPKPASSWQVRMERVTANSTSGAVQNDTYFDTLTEIVDVPLNYPNSALVAVRIDSSQFNRIPNRAYLVDGLYIRVPSNYDPISRAYTGVWDGTFKVAVSNNPAWVLYDLLTNARYGLGQYLSDDQVDKASLYQIGRYCDELVPDGYGGSEPRFTLNTAIQTQAEAYRLISDLTSVFRGMAFWNGAEIAFTQDSPAEPVMVFSPANVVDGLFTYTGSSRKDRHSVALVTWNDPRENYKQKIEYVENAEMVARIGVRKVETVAVGATSQGQAHRFGRWILYTEQFESDMVQFKVGIDAALVIPGEVVRIHDPNRAGKRLGGRLLACTSFSATLDAPVTIGTGSSIAIRLPDGTFAERAILEPAGTNETVTWADGLPELPVANAIWLISEPELQPMLARVISIAQDTSNPNEYVIAALEHNPSKYAAVEQDLRLEAQPTSIIDAAPGAVTDLQVTESLYMISPVLVGARVMMSWSGEAVKYRITLESDADNPRVMDTLVPSYSFDNLQPGVYRFSVQPVGILGKLGPRSTVQAEIFGKTRRPVDVSGFALAAIAGQAHVSFDPSPDLDVVVGGYLRVRHSRALTGATWNDSTDVGAQIPGTASSAVLPLLSGTYLAKWVDSSGFESAGPALISTNAPQLIGMNFVVALDEAPDFSGQPVGLVMDTIDGAPALVLDSAATIDEMTLPVDSWPRISLLGGVAPRGEYLFSQRVDLGAVCVARLSANLTTVAFDSANTVDDWVSIDALTSIDGADLGAVSARIEVRSTDADPALNQWSAWQPLYVGDWSARAYEFRCVLQSALPTQNIGVTGLSVEVDMPDRVQSADDLSCPDSGRRVDFGVPFFAAPALAITAQGMQTGDYFEISNKDETGFDIMFKNTAGTGVARTFDYIARSY